MTGWIRRFAAPRHPLSAWSVTLDCVIAAAATVLVIAEAFSNARGGHPFRLLLPGVATFPSVGSPGPSAGALIIDGLTAAPLAMRRLYPLAACVVILSAVLAGARPGLPAMSFATAVLAVYSAVVYSQFPRLAVAISLTGVIAGTIISADTLPRFPSRFTALVAFVPTIAVALGMRSWRRRASDSAARLRRAEAEHKAATMRALELERTRIAAELHDVVTHNVSVMMVQAGAARQILDTSPAEAREALLAVEASGRTAMTELRALVGLLCQNGDNPDELLRPQPGLAALSELIDRVTAAGLKVDLHDSGLNIGSSSADSPSADSSSAGSPGAGPRAIALPPGLDLAAYRVVQEGLTNVIKHAGQAPATVRISHRLGELVITVSDTGPGSGGVVGASSSEDPGRGIIGLRERLALYGGSLDAGPRPGGGWRLRARVPLEAS